jgi:trk/ktr system potassium uptake protein
MRRFIARLPFLIALIGIASLAMLIPAAMAMVTEDFETGRAFLYAALFFLILTMLLGFATQSSPPVTSARPLLLGLIAAYALLPVVLAVPVMDSIGNTTFFNAYFEMVSSLTTTGATVFDTDRLAPAVHLWRGLVGWFGGFLIWVTAAAVMAPLSLGGFEVTADAQIGAVTSSAAQMRAANPGERLRRTMRQLAPVYIGLTAILWLLQVLAGEADLAAAIHAMSTMATSGISPDGALSGGQGGLLSEIFILLFLAFAITRHSFSRRPDAAMLRVLGQDRELRLALYVTVTLTALLFLRHWIGALELADRGSGRDALAALWGSFFTAVSFATTTGFVSDYWGASRSWSGLPTPGLVLVGLALMGGGVATTAGGIKLLRVYALYKHGTREMSKLIHPHSVASGGQLGRRIRRQGAYIAWVFFMLFILSMAATMLALAAAGVGFEQALVLAVSALSTTGPLATYGAGDPIIHAALSDPAKAILAAAMIIGRLETLVLIALLNPSYWRV